MALFDLTSKVNAVYPTLAKEIGLSIRPTDIGAQKINNNTLDTYGIIGLAFLITGKANQVRFLKKTFLLANISPEVFFGMLFLTLSDVHVDFLD